MNVAFTMLGSVTVSEARKRCVDCGSDLSLQPGSSSNESQFLLFRYSAVDWPLGSVAGDLPSHRVSLASCGG